LLRRLLVLAVQLYLTADYCDPSVPGVFFFESDSYFVESIEAKPAMPVLASPAMRGVLPVREVLEPPTPRATARRERATRSLLTAFVCRRLVPGRSGDVGRTLVLASLGS